MTSELSPCKKWFESKANDVLCGKGSYAYCHPGNAYFRSLISKHKLNYVMGDTIRKTNIANQIVEEIKALDPPGRFLKKRKKNSNASENVEWEDIGEEATISKTRQALRVGANTIKDKHHNIRRNLSVIESYSGIEEIPSFTTSYQNYAQDDYRSQLPLNTPPIQEFNHLSTSSIFTLQNSNESSIPLGENEIIRNEQMKNELNPTATSLPYYMSVPQNSYGSSNNAEQFTAHPPSTQKDSSASNVSCIKKSLNPTQQHCAYTQPCSLPQEDINTEINSSPVNESSVLGSKGRALTPLDYSPREDPSPDAFNNLPFFPIDKSNRNRKKKRKLELNHSDITALCNQEMEELVIPRSVSLAESFSYNADENEHPHEDELDNVQRYAEDWKNDFLPQSFTNNISEKDRIQNTVENNIAASPLKLVVSCSSSKDTSAIANDTKKASNEYRKWWSHSHHFDNMSAQPGNTYQHQFEKNLQLNHRPSFQEDDASYYAVSGENAYQEKHHAHQHGDVSPVENQIFTKSVSYDLHY